MHLQDPQYEPRFRTMVLSKTCGGVASSGSLRIGYHDREIRCEPQTSSEVVAGDACANLRRLHGFLKPIALLLSNGRMNCCGLVCLVLLHLSSELKSPSSPSPAVPENRELETPEIAVPWRWLTQLATRRSSPLLFLFRLLLLPMCAPGWLGIDVAPQIFL